MVLYTIIGNEQFCQNVQHNVSHWLLLHGMNTKQPLVCFSIVNMFRQCVQKNPTGSFCSPEEQNHNNSVQQKEMWIIKWSILSCSLSHSVARPLALFLSQTFWILWLIMEAVVSWLSDSSRYGVHLLDKLVELHIIITWSVTTETSCEVCSVEWSQYLTYFSTKYKPGDESLYGPVVRQRLGILTRMD